MRSLRAVLVAGLVAIGLPGAVSAVPLPRGIVADAAPVPAGTTWSAPTATVSANLVFQPSHPAALARLVTEQQTIGSPQYHHFLPRGAFARTFGASPPTVAALRHYLTSFGIHVGPLQPNGLSVTITGRTTDLARAFATSLRRGHVQHHSFTVFTAPASLPATLARSVAGVTGLSRLVVAHHATVVRHGTYGGSATCSGPGSMSNNYGDITPAAQAALFGLSPSWSSGHTGSGQTIAIYSLAPYGPTAVASFFSCYGLSLTTLSSRVMAGASLTLSRWNTADQEPTMDIEQAAVLAPGAAIVNYLGVNDNVGPTNLYAQIANDDVATIVSTSWGICEVQSDVAAETPIFQQMAAQGQSVIAASGDTGSSDCYDPTQPNASSALAVDDPAAQATVTGVGGLTVTLNATTVIPAQYSVWNDGQGAGGGGYATTIARPTWQVATGLSTTGPNATKRAVPDLAVMADPSTGFAATWSGNLDNQPVGWTSVGGTSIGAPIVAAVAADAADACGPGTKLGLLNPRLYAMAAAKTGFLDVTQGSNDLFNTGFYRAGVGYDPASGLGTIDPATFVSDLCAQQPSPTLSTVTWSTTTTGLDSAGSTLTVTLKSVTGQPLAGATVTVTGTQTGANVSATPSNPVTNATGAATFVVQSNRPGQATVTVSVGAVVLGTTTLTFTAPWSTSTATSLMTKLGAFAVARDAQAAAGVVVAARTTTNQIKVAGPGVAPVVNLTSGHPTVTSTATPSVGCSVNRCDVAITAGTHLVVITNVFAAKTYVDVTAKNPLLPVPVGAPALLATATGDTIAYTTATRSVMLLAVSSSGALVSAVNLGLKASAPPITGYPTIVSTSAGPIVAAATAGTDIVFVQSAGVWKAINVLQTIWGQSHRTVSGDPSVGATSSTLTLATRTTSGDTLITSAPLSALTTWTGQDVAGALATRAVAVGTSATRTVILGFTATTLTVLVNGPSWRTLSWDTIIGSNVTVGSVVTGAVPLAQSGTQWTTWSF